MPEKPIRILVVDDSAFIRNALSSIIRKDPGLEVIGQASDGGEAIEMTRKLKPDIVTLDVIMPKVSGLEALEKIIEISPKTSVLMVSMLTEEGAKSTLEALSKGAVDFIPKSLGDSPQSLFKLEIELISKLKAIGRKRLLIPARPVKKVGVENFIKTAKKKPAEIIAIGTSTGGPKALLEMLPRLPEDLPVGGIIVQHMPESFIKPFAQSLNEKSSIEVKVAENGDYIKPGQFLLAPTNLHLKIKRFGQKNLIVRLDPRPSDTLHRPSVDQAFLSIAKIFDGNALGVIMTGMGHDGLEGARAMKNSNNTILAQDESSCVVYGMPRAVVDEKLADCILPLSDLPAFINLSARR